MRGNSTYFTTVRFVTILDGVWSWSYAPKYSRTSQKLVSASVCHTDISKNIFINLDSLEIFVCNTKIRKIIFWSFGRNLSKSSSIKRLFSFSAPKASFFISCILQMPFFCSINNVLDIL